MGGMQGWGAVKRPGDEPVFGRNGRPGRSRSACCRCGPPARTSTRSGTHSSRQSPMNYIDDGYYGRWLPRGRDAARRLRRSSRPARSRRGPATCAVKTSRSRPGPSRTSPTTRRPRPARCARSPSRRLSPSATRCAPRTSDPPETHAAAAVRAWSRGRDRRASSPRRCCRTHTPHFQGENAQHVYSVRFDSHELWGPDAERFTLNIDLYESYLEAAS